MALEIAAAAVSFLFHVTDEGLDGGSAAQLSFDRADDATLLAGDEHPARLRRVVSAVSLVDVGALDLSSGEALGVLEGGLQCMTVVGIAGQGFGVQHELAARGAGVGGDDRDLDAELVGRTGLALANALDLRVWEARESGLSKAASTGSWPAMLRRISRISRPSRVRRKRTCRWWRLNCLAWA
jgi:hypothetical protein